MRMDRIEKALFILPCISLFDIVAILFSLNFGGEEVGIIADPIYQVYGELGLLGWAVFLFFLFIALVWFLIYGKRKTISQKDAKKYRIFFLIAFHIVFLSEGVWMGTVIQNFLVPFLST